MPLIRCRLCLKQGVHEIDASVDKIQSIIFHIFSFVVKPNDETKMICIECHRLLDSFYLFHIKVTEAQQQLLTGKINAESHDFDAETVSKLINTSEKIVSSLEPEISNDTVEFPTELIRNSKFILTGKHLDQVMENFFDMKCIQCEGEEKFSSLYFLFNHLRTEHGLKASVTCNLCDVTVYSRRTAKYHVAYHLQPSAFECEICRKKFRVLSTLANHSKIHQQDGHKKNYKCDQCDKSFSLLASLRSHKGKHKKTAKTCKICLKMFPCYSSYTCHLTDHSSGDNLCSQCGKSFNSKHRLAVHMLTHDANGKNKIKCEDCGTVLKNQLNYREHIKKHDPTRQVFCSQCDYSTHSPKRLTLHKKKHADKQYSCTVCDKKFALQSYVKIHMAQHTGERKYSCEYCPRTFASSGNYYSHRKRMHLDRLESEQTQT